MVCLCSFHCLDTCLASHPTDKETCYNGMPFEIKHISQSPILIKPLVSIEHFCIFNVASLVFRSFIAWDKGKALDINGRNPEVKFGSMAYIDTLLSDPQLLHLHGGKNRALLPDFLLRW